MAKISRVEARDILFKLLFETEFRSGDEPQNIYALACENREIPHNNYIKDTFFGVVSKSEVLDAIITKYSKGWKADRLSKVSRTVIRIAVYEMLYADDIPSNVSISQAVELTLKYGEDGAKRFVNGVLSGFFKDSNEKGFEAVVAEALAEKATKGASTDESAEVEAEEPASAEENA
ncbi:MAG: transcription antitermination factor NusB [Clostridia bacterium]|nr:transcription antitermination factor NusB [Clostridia bacterium]